MKNTLIVFGLMFVSVPSYAVTDKVIEKMIKAAIYTNCTVSDLTYDENLSITSMCDNETRAFAAIETVYAWLMAHGSYVQHKATLSKDVSPKEFYKFLDDNLTTSR
jgi:hypothetical protein